MPSLSVSTGAFTLPPLRLRMPSLTSPSVSALSPSVHQRVFLGIGEAVAVTVGTPAGRVVSVRHAQGLVFAGSVWLATMSLSVVRDASDSSALIDAVAVSVHGRGRVRADFRAVAARRRRPCPGRWVGAQRGLVLSSRPSPSLLVAGSCSRPAPTGVRERARWRCLLLHREIALARVQPEQLRLHRVRCPAALLSGCRWGSPSRVLSAPAATAKSCERTVTALPDGSMRLICRRYVPPVME